MQRTRLHITMARTARAVLGAALGGLLLVVGPLAAPSRAATVSVSAADNFFLPEEINVEVGDTVVWTNTGRNVHTVTSDKKGVFDSGNFGSNETFQRTFNKEGNFFYFCKIHGARGGVGMAGLVVVGDPEEPGGGGGGKDKRKKIVVPRDYKTIQAAVNAARPHTTILVKPGTYRESVIVATRDLKIKGYDRFRTVLNGDDVREFGILVDHVDGVTIANLTVRNYAPNGIYFHGATNYVANKIDSIKNRTYGIYAFDSYDGVIKNSFGYGSGDAAFYIGQCLGCSALVENVTATTNFIGYSGTNSTGVVVRDSVFKNNGVGVVPSTWPSELFGPNRGTHVLNNLIENNNYDSIPAAPGVILGLPFGTGVWLLGVKNNVVADNTIRGHDRYGVLVTESLVSDPPVNNRVAGNSITDAGMFDLAWDGTGSDDCFQGNDISGQTGPADIQTLYACALKPFDGTPFAPVQEDVAAAISDTDREQTEPPEPSRPRCQKGTKGCKR